MIGRRAVGVAAMLVMDMGMPVMIVSVVMMIVRDASVAVCVVVCAVICACEVIAS